MASVSVMLAMPSLSGFPVETLMSLWATQKLLLARNIVPTICIPTGCSIGAFDARNQCAHEFLKGDYTHLFFVDSDMAWEAQDFLRVLALATKLPFIGVAGPLKRKERKFAYRIDGDMKVVLDEFGCIKVKSIGLAFACVQRMVMERLAEKAQLISAPGRGEEKIRAIFRTEIRDGELYGEDIAFCEDVSALGFSINVEPHITLGHIGTKEYRHGAIADCWKTHG